MSDLATPADLPVPLDTFANSVRGTDEEVWLTWLRSQHGAERHTLTEWRGLIGRYAHQPAR